MNLDQIELYQNFSKEVSHNISIDKKEKENFIPTKFIYTMITFNIIYEYICKDYDLEIYVNEKIDLLIEKIFDSEDLKELYNKLKLSDLDIEVLKNIRNDNSIRKNIILKGNNLNISYKKAFLDSVAFIKDNKKIQAKELLRILLYINRIRNNFFHGSKSLGDILDSLNKRLEIYTNIVLAVNEICIKKLQKEKVEE